MTIQIETASIAIARFFKNQVKTIFQRHYSTRRVHNRNDLVINQLALRVTKKLKVCQQCAGSCVTVENMPAHKAPSVIVKSSVYIPVIAVIKSVRFSQPCVL